MDSNIEAYTYDADVHCNDCAREYPGVTLSENGMWLEGEDSEGNEIHPVYNWDTEFFADHDFDEGPAVQGCGTCGRIIEYIAYEGALPYVYPIATELGDIMFEWLEHHRPDNDDVDDVDDVLDIIHAMMDEARGGSRRFPKPITGGANQAPFDGELLGRFLRFTILCEVRDKIVGIDTPKHYIKEMFESGSVNHAQ